MKRVLLLGNGSSRKELKDEIRNWTDEIWACNDAYLEVDEFGGLSRLCSVHNGKIREASKFREGTGRVFLLVGRMGVTRCDRFFALNRGWSTGSLALYDALFEGYDVVLAGFDFGGRDVYQEGDLVGSNFVKQFIQVTKKWGMDRIRFLCPGGETKPVREYLLSRYEKSFHRDEALYQYLLSTGMSAEGKRTDGVKKKTQTEEAYSKKLVPSKLVQLANQSPNERRLSMMRKLPKYRLPEGVGSVLIIGNGPSVLQSKMGNRIDTEFDLVVRLNDFVLEGYETSVGTRTDVWFNGANQDFFYSKTRDTTNIGSIVLGLPTARLNKLEHPQHYFELREKVLSSIGQDISSCEKLHIVALSEVSRIRKVSAISYPSVGFLAVAYFSLILNTSTITLFGFDWYQSGTYHYYDGDGKSKAGNAGRVHNWNAERTWVDGLRKSGRVYVLGEQA